MIRDLFRTLNTLFLLADEALADRIIKQEFLVSAQRRIWLYEHGERHMCLAPGCRVPVIGRHIFAHCETHLDTSEVRWVKEEIETKPDTPPTRDPAFQKKHPEAQLFRAHSLFSGCQRAARPSRSCLWGRRRTIY